MFEFVRNYVQLMVVHKEKANPRTDVYNESIAPKVSKRDNKVITRKIDIPEYVVIEYRINVIIPYVWNFHSTNLSHYIIRFRKNWKVFIHIAYFVEYLNEYLQGKAKRH